MPKLIVVVTLLCVLSAIPSKGYSAEGPGEGQILDPAVHNVTRLEPLRFWKRDR